MPGGFVARLIGRLVPRNRTPSFAPGPGIGVDGACAHEERFPFAELLAALAPRAFFAAAATRDSDFDVTGVRETLAAAEPVYALLKCPQRLQAVYPEAEHSFPPEARQARAPLHGSRV